MTSTNDGKDVKSYRTIGPKGKAYYIELYTSLEARLSEGGDPSGRTKYLCEAWRRVHSLCQHSTHSTQTHLLNWLQRHTARAVLQTEWQRPERKDDRRSLEEAIDAFIADAETAKESRNEGSTSWEVDLVARGEWFKRVLEHPWDHPVLTLLLNPNGTPPTDDEVLEWLKEERGVTFVMRLHTLVGEKCDDIAMSLATAVMERVRAALPPLTDSDEPKDVPPPENAEPTFGDKLKEAAGFTPEVWEMLTDIEFVLLHKRDSNRCIALAKQTPLLGAHLLIERLQKRLDIAPREKRLWKNAKEVAILIAQVVIARCMMVPCAGAGHTALFCCARLLAQQLAARLPAAADALAARAPTARHLHALAHAVDVQLAPTNDSMKPYICELYVRAITAGMNELERLKLKTEKEAEARSMEKTLASWFVQLGEVLSRSVRIRCECTLTAFSLHPSQNMYERLHALPQPAPVAKDSDESKEETVKTEFGSWASDSRSQTNFVKTSETLKMKHTQNQANVMSTAIFNEGEALGLSPELCQDIAVLLSGPRVKTLSWDMDRTLLLENCRAYSKQTHGGTRTLTRELKYLNIDPNQYKHLPEDRDDDENDPYYGIERGYEHLAVPEYPEEIWEDANYLDRTDTASSSIEDDFIVPRREKKNRRIPLTSDEDSDPLSFMAEAKRVQKKKERPHSKERSKERAKKKQEPVLTELVDPLDIVGLNTQNQNQKKNKPKEKKERKKKEKIPKVKVEKRMSLANLVGVKVVKNKRKPAKNTTIVKTPETNSNYDSQGKCSWTSIHSEDKEYDEGLFSIDELKSYEGINQRCSLKLMKNNESLVPNSKVNAKISSSPHLQRPPNNLISLPYRPSTPNVIRGQSPSSHSRNLSPKLSKYPDDVKASITKLLEFRRQNLKLQNTPHTPPRKPAIIRQDVPMQSNISPKAVTIPEIPKSYIQKQHAEKLAELKREVNSILAQRREMKTYSKDSVIQYANKSGVDKAVTPCGNAYRPRSGGHQPNTNSLKMTDFVNVPYDRLMTEIAERQERSNNEVMKSPHIQHQPGQYGLQRSLCTETAGQRDYQKFLKEYEQSKYSSYALDMSAKRPAKEVKKNIKPVSRVVPIVPNVTKPESKTPQCAKQSTQVKKPDNYLNTFSRLNYMHKNKQTELKSKNSTEKSAFSTSTYQEVSSELDQIIKEHQRAQMRVIQAKHEQFDRLLEKSSNTSEFDKKSETPGAKDPLLFNLLQSSSSSTSITPWCRNESQLKNYQTQQKPVSPPKTSLSDKDQNDLLNLLWQQNKLNVSLHRSTSMISKPSTSNSNNAISNNFRSMTENNSTTSTSKSNNAMINNFSSINDNNSKYGQMQQRKKPANHVNDSSPSSLETKIINIISNSLAKQQTNVNAEKCDSVKSKSVMYPIIKSSRTTDSHDKDKKNAANKGHVKQNSVKYAPELEKSDWQAVMSELSRLKTPTRGLNNKSSFELAFEKSLQKPSIFASKQSTSENNFESVNKKGKADAPKSATTLAHDVITNKGLKIKAGVPKQQKAPANLKNSSNLSKSPDIAMNNKIVKQNYHEVAKKLPQDLQMKQFTYAVPKNDDPFISGISNSDYDLLEELMDDDLRKEIGELSSDDESYNAAAQSFLKPTKGNEKRVSVEFNKPLNDMSSKKSATDVRCLNAFQTPCETMQSATQKPVIQCTNKMLQMTHKTNNIKVSINISNNKIQDNIGSITSTSLSSPAQLLATPNTQNQAYGHVKTLCKKQEGIDSKMYIPDVTQQAQLQNVVLIGSELVYERYTAVQTPLHCVSNTAPSTYVALNNAPSLTFYQTTQFTSPLVNPLIIGSSITMPIVNNVSCATTPTQPSVISDLPQPLYPNTTVESITPLLGPHMDMETCHTKDEVSNSLPETDYPLRNNKILDGNKAIERKVLSEVQELAVNKKIEKTRTQKIEYDMKDASANEERLKKKRLAIINREINHRCGDKPIPLAYSRLPVKTQPVSKQHSFSEVVPLTFAPLCPNENKHNSSDCEEEKLLTQIKNDLQDLSDSINNVQSPATADSNESKENKTLATISYRRILLRSSNKIQTKSNIEIVSESSTNKKSKVKLKSETSEARDELSKKYVNDKEAITPKRASKRLRNKTLIIAKEEKTQPKNQRRKQSPGTKLPPKSKVQSKSVDKNEKPAVSSINNEMAVFDIEAELLGSKISKLVSKMRDEKDSNKSRNPEIGKTIAAAKERYDITSVISIPLKTECVTEYTTDEKTDGVGANVIVNSVREKFNDKLIKKTNEQVGDVSNDKTDKNAIVENVSNMPTCRDFVAVQENPAAKNVKDVTQEISLPQKAKCAPEHTADVKIVDITDNMVPNSMNEKCEKVMTANYVSEDKFFENTNDTNGKVADKLSTCNDFSKNLTTDEDYLKVSSDVWDFNYIKSVPVTGSEILVTNDIIKPTTDTYDTFEKAENITSVDEKNESILAAKENIDLDMTVTCEEVHVSKLGPILAKIKTARNTSINAENNNGVTISDDELKQNHILVPTSSDTSKKTEFYIKNIDVAPVPASWKLDNQRFGSDHDEPSGSLSKALTITNMSNVDDNSKTKASCGTHSDVRTITSTTADIDDEIVILDDDSQIKEPSKTHSMVPAITHVMANTDDCIIIQDVDSEIKELDDSQTKLSYGTNSEIPTTINTPATTDNDIIILDDVSKTTSEASLIKHGSDAAQKKPTQIHALATPSHTGTNDASEIPQTFKDSIHIEHLPSDDPLQKRARVLLPNGRKIIATMYGAVHVTFDTLFANPSMKSKLLNGLNYKKLYTTTLKQITKVVKCDPTKIISAQILNETIDLLSDEDDECPARTTETNTQAFETEYGKYNISTIDQDIFAKHQAKFSVKSIISLKKIDSKPGSKIDIMQKKTELYQNKIVPSSIPYQYVTGLIKDIEDKLSSEIKQTSGDEIVEIDDSSNDSLDHDKSSGIMQPEGTINELKNVLLKELGVEQAQIPRNILQKNRNENRKTNVEEINSKEKSGHLNSNLQLSANPTEETFALDDVDKEELFKIINKKCFIQLIRCDDLVEMYKTNNTSDRKYEKIDKRIIQTKSLSAKVLDDELLSAKVPDDDAIVITEDFSILNDLDENIVESESRGSSPVIELPDVLISLDNKSLMHSESDHQIIPFSCEAYWFTTKPMLHNVNRNTLKQPNINEEIHYKSSISCVVNEISARTGPTQNNCAPSLMSMVLKCFQNTCIVHQYVLLHKTIIPSSVNSLKRKSSSLRKRSAFKVPKLNDESIVEKLIDYSHSSTAATPGSSLTDMDNVSAPIIDDANVNSEIEINGDKSIDCTKNRRQTDNEEVDQISSSLCTANWGDNHNMDERNDDERQVFKDDCCESHNDKKEYDRDSSYDTHDCDLEIINIMPENNTSHINSIYKDCVISLESINTFDVSDITHIDSGSECRSPSPVIEISHLIDDDKSLISKSMLEIEKTPFECYIDINPNCLSSSSGATAPSIGVKTILDEQVAVIHVGSNNENSSTPQVKETTNTNSDRRNSNYINALSLEFETKQETQKKIHIDSTNKISLILQEKKEADTLLESDVTNICGIRDISQCQHSIITVTDDFDDIEMKLPEQVVASVKDVTIETQILENCNLVKVSNETNEIHDIEINLAEMFGESVKDVATEIHSQQSCNLIKVYNEMNENDSQENFNRDSETAVGIKIKTDDKSNLRTMEFNGNHKEKSVHSEDVSNIDKLLVENPSQQCSTIRDHEYVNSFIAKPLSSRVNKDSTCNHEASYVSAPLEEGVIELHSNEILGSSLLQNTITKIESDKIEARDSTYHEEVSTTIDDDCFNQIEEQDKETENVVNIESDIFDLETNDINLSSTVDDDSPTQVEEKHQKTEHVEGDILNEKPSFNFAIINKNMSKIINDNFSSPAEAKEMETVILEYALNAKETYDLPIHDENLPEIIGDNNSAPGEAQEMETEILEDALNTKQTRNSPIHDEDIPEIFGENRSSPAEAQEMETEILEDALNTKETCYLPIHDVAIPEIVGESRSSSAEAQKMKTEILKEASNDKETCGLPTHDENVLYIIGENCSCLIGDNCSSPAEAEEMKTKALEDALTTKETRYSQIHDENIPKILGDNRFSLVEAQEMKTEVLKEAINEKETFEPTHDENVPNIIGYYYSRPIGNNSSSPAEAEEIESEILEDALKTKEPCYLPIHCEDIPEIVGDNRSSSAEAQEMKTEVLKQLTFDSPTHDEKVPNIIGYNCSRPIGDNSSSPAEAEEIEIEILEDALNTKKTCYLPIHDKKRPEIVGDNRSSPAEAQEMKTEVMKQASDEKETYDSPTHDEKVPNIIGDSCSHSVGDNCSSPAEAKEIKTKILEEALNEKEAFDSSAHENVSSAVDEDGSSIIESLKDTLLEKQKRNKLFTENLYENCDLSIDKGIDIKEKSTFTSTDVSAETILSKYLKLIGNDSEVLEGIVEYEDPEAGTCYVIPVIDKSSVTGFDSNENTEVVTAIIQGLDVNRVETVADEIINSDSDHDITQSDPLINDQALYCDIEAKLAKIVGEPLKDVDTEEQNVQNCYKTLKITNVETAAAKVSLDEKYKTSYNVEVVSGYDSESEEIVRQLIGTNNSDKVNEKTVHSESLEGSSSKECLAISIKKGQSENHENILDPEDDNFEVTVPKHTYLKGTKHIRQRWKNLKRKMDMSDTKTNERKYRKGKNIDYPKITTAAMSESAYAKEYKRLIDYCSSIKFSYAVPFHKVYVDVHNTLRSWPIKSSNVATAEVTTEANGTLFTDIEKSEALLNPMEQSLSDEIMSEYNENTYTFSNINETNFNMGFGERSDRVIQEPKDGEYTTFSAATLSDVKQLQPCLPSDKQEALVNQNIINNEQQDQLLKTLRFVDRLNLREKVRSFFKKTEAELTLNTLYSLHSKKYFENTNDDSDWPFGDLTSPRFIRPSPFEATVNVVQVGQLPVSAAAQNPVPCDPRVTHVSNVSPQRSSDNSSGDELQTTIKTEYTELTTANITLPLMQGYAQHHHSTPTESHESTNLYGANNTISMSSELKSVVKIELMEEDTSQENLDYEYDGMHHMSNGNMNNGEQYHFNNIANNIATEPDSNAPVVNNSLKKPKTAPSFLKDKQQDDTSDRSYQISHAMNATGISAMQGIAKPNGTASLGKLAQNAQSDVTTSQANTSNYSKSTPINAIALQQALAQILPPPLNQTSTSDSSQQTSANPQVLHIVQGGNNAQSVINKSNGTQLLHIVQNKSATTTNGTPTSQQNTFSGLSLVDGAIQQNGNQLLHIVNTGNQKNSNAGQLLKRVNLLTNLANVQGSNEQKMVQFVCKSADGKSIQLPHQRSMVLRLQPLDPSNPKPKQNEAQDLIPSSSTTQSTNGKEPNSLEMKSRSLYEEINNRLVQNGDTKPSQEKSTSLPKFNQVFGKQVYQEKQNEINGENVPENSECPPEDTNVQLEQINDVGSPPILIRKPQSQPSQPQPNLAQQIKQTIGSSNIQTMHGGVIYTRQIPVNLGNGQTINLITVPSTEMVDDSAKNQKTDAKFGNQEGDTPVIKIVPTNQPATTTNGSTDDNNAKMRSTNEATPQQTPQPQPVLTQMRIKLPMLSKAPQMVGGTRVVRPAFFQIQRNVIGGANQQVYQQLVLTAAPPLGQSIRVPAQAQKPKASSENQSSPESQMSSSTLEQLREFDMVLEQVKERSTVQPGSSTSSTDNFTNLKTSPDTTDAPTPSTSTQDSSTPVLYSVGNTQPLNYVNRKSSITSTTTSSYVRSPDSTGVIESPSSSTPAHSQHTATSDSCASSSCASEAAAATSATPKPKKKKSKPSTSNSNPFNIKNTPKPSSQKPFEDEQTTQRILYILAEYKEQVENSPDKDKPAPRRRNNPAAPGVGSSKRKKSCSGSRRQDMSPVAGEDSCRTMGSEDSSCGTSHGECNEYLETHSPEESPRKVVRRLTFEQETHITQTRTIPQRNVIVTDGQAFAVRGATGKPATTVLMPANYLLPVSMVKGGQQIAIMTNRGPKLLVGAGEGGAGGTLLFQRLIGPGGLKPMLARPGVRHIRLPTTALHNLQAFNIATSAATAQPPDSTASPAPASTPPDLVDTRAMSSPWPDRDAGEVKPERGNSSPEGSEPWNLPSSSIADDYGYEEIVRTENMDRTVLDAIPDRYSPDMEAQRIFDKMFDSDSKKSMYDSRCGYDIDASDDDKAYHQVVQRKDGRHTTRLTHVSAAALRHKYAILEHELRLQKSLSEECEDLGVDSPSASELFPEAELFFAPSPAQEQTIEHCQTPPLTVLSQGIPQPDIDDQVATDHLTHSDRHDELDINLDDVGEIVTVGEDGMTTIPLDHEEFARSHEEFARSHPNTTFHSEPEDGEIPPFTIAQGIKGRQVTFHTRGVPGTVVVAPQTTVISQATVEASGTQNTVKFTDIDNMINAMPSPQHPQIVNMPSVLVKDGNEGLSKFDRLLNESRELHLSNTASAIVHSTGNGTQVIRRVHYETRRDARYLNENRDALTTGEAKMAGDDRRGMQSMGNNNTSSERHSKLFWESNTPARPERRRFEFSSDSDKCCKSRYDEASSDSSGIGAHTRLDSVIKAPRTERRRSDGSATDDGHPPLRTYPPKRPHSHHPHHSELERGGTAKTRTNDRCHDVKDESRRRASNRGVVKRGCHCCNGSNAPPKPKKSRPKKSIDFHTH